MSEQEKGTFAAVAEGVNGLITKSDEDTLLAITAGYLAGKEAGRREAKAEIQPETAE